MTAAAITASEADHALTRTVEAVFPKRPKAWKRLKSCLLSKRAQATQDTKNELKGWLVQTVLKNVPCYGRQRNIGHSVSRHSSGLHPPRCLEKTRWNILEGLAQACPSLIRKNAPRSVIDMATTGYLHQTTNGPTSSAMRMLLQRAMNASDATFLAVAQVISRRSNVTTKGLDCLRENNDNDDGGNPNETLEDESTVDDHNTEEDDDDRVSLQNLSAQKIDTMCRYFDSCCIRRAARELMMNSGPPLLEWGKFSTIILSIDNAQPEPFFQKYLKFMLEGVQESAWRHDWTSILSELIADHVHLMAENDSKIFKEQDSCGNTFVQYLVRNFGPGSAEAVGIICDACPESLRIPNNNNQLASQVTLGEMMEQAMDYEHSEVPIKFPLTTCYFIANAYPEGLFSHTRRFERTQFHSLVLDSLQTIYDCGLHCFDDHELDYEVRMAVLKLIQACVKVNPTCMNISDAFGNTPLHDIARIANLDKLPETDQARFSHFTTKFRPRNVDTPDTLSQIIQLVASRTAATMRNKKNLMPMHVLYSTTQDDFVESTPHTFVLDAIFKAAPEVLEEPCPMTKLYPFQLAASRSTDDWRATEAVDDIYKLLSAAPHLVMAHADRNKKTILDNEEFIWAARMEMEASRLEVVACELRRKAKRAYKKLREPTR